MRCWRGITLNRWVLLGSLGTILSGIIHGAEPVSDPLELPRLVAKEAGDAMAAIRIRSGFQMELAAAEPEVMDPVAMSFDEAERLYVVEMRGYSERRDDKLGRIRLLEDRDRDGRYETARVFADGLAWPTAVICWDGGVFVGVTPDILYLKDEDGDGKADTKRVVYTGFGSDVSRLNVQALMNSFQWGLDNRIHGVASFSAGTVIRSGAAGTGGAADAKPVPVLLRGRDFSFDPRTLDFRAESGGGQHGMSFDNAGRKYVCSNSRHLQQVMVEDQYAGRNPHQVMPSPLLDIAVDGPSAEVFRISPDEPWRIVRTRWRVAGLVDGPVEGGGRVSGYFTAATGVTIYRGDAFPSSWVGDAFIGDAGSNLIHHKKLQPDGVAMSGARPEDEAGVEFAASTDNWFRPVQFVNGPDGCLYVADMCREVIEHPWSLPETIKGHLDLNSGNDRGRIYRVTPAQYERPKYRGLEGADTKTLVAALDHANGWHRDTAARLLYARQDGGAVAGLRRMAGGGKRAEGRVHALYALEGLQQLDAGILMGALRDADAVVRRHAVRLSEVVLRRQTLLAAELWEGLMQLAGDEDAEVRYQLAFTLGELADPARIDALVMIGERDFANVWVQAAVLNSLGDPEQGGAFRLFQALMLNPAVIRLPNGREFIGRASRMIGVQNRAQGIDQLLAGLGGVADMEAAGIILRELGEGLKQAGGSLESYARQMNGGGWVERASLQALNTSATKGDRVAAVRLLGLVTGPAAQDALFRVVESSGDETLRVEAMREIVRRTDSRGGARLLDGMKGLTPALRREAVSLMLRMPKLTAQLLDAIESGEVEVDWIGPDQAGALRTHRDSEVRGRAVRLFGPGIEPADRKEDLTKALQMTGDSVRGRAIYLERCASCHRAGNEGHVLGPDLETVKNAGREKTMANLLEPNLEVAPNYVSYDVTLKGGEMLSGILVGETVNGLTVRQANGVETGLLRSNVMGMTSSGKSVMPEGLTEGLGPQGLADLLEFIARLGER